MRHFQTFSILFSPSYHTYPWYGGGGPKTILREFEKVCHSIFVGDTCIDRIFFKYFPYTFHDDARLWYDSLDPSAFSTWMSFRSLFFQVFVPPHLIWAHGVQAQELQISAFSPA